MYLDKIIRYTPAPIRSGMCIVVDIGNEFTLCLLPFPVAGTGNSHIMLFYEPEPRMIIRVQRGDLSGICPGVIVDHDHFEKPAVKGLDSKGVQTPLQ
jgi:hypothetical protein